MDERALTAPEPLWREITGRILGRRRHERGERLVETAERAGVSSQYLSELERGRKDASSEVLEAVVGALEMTLAEFTRLAAIELSRRMPVFEGASTIPATASSPSAGFGRPLALACA